MPSTWQQLGSQSLRLAAWILAALVATPARSGTLSVGPGQSYAKPCDAIAAAQPGDVIEVGADVERAAVRGPDHLGVRSLVSARRAKLYDLDP